MRHVAVIGSGPAGYYVAEAAGRQWGDGVRVDVIDRLPVPNGLIRTGVAPDHQSINAVSRRYEAMALGDNVHFMGNVTLGKDVSVDELLALYDAVVLATGAPSDRPLEVPGATADGRARRGDRGGQRRAGLRAHPGKGASGVRGFGHRRPRAGCADGFRRSPRDDPGASRAVAGGNDAEKSWASCSGWSARRR